VGAFAYSPVKGAAANVLPDPVPPEIQQERLARFMQHQEEISKQRLAAKKGQQFRVLVDIVDENRAIARSYADAPEIDGVVYIDDASTLKPGDWADVRVIDTDIHDLWAKKI